jgi:hypothetical protein
MYLLNLINKKTKTTVSISSVATLSIILTGLVSLSGCARVGNALNPFQEELPPVAYAGNPNDHALRSEGGNPEAAREALQEVGQYPRAHQPQPYNPVMQPAVVRLMWVPDHLNGNGDLVPAHFYYLKVLDDRWALTDVFERQKMINNAGGPASNIPFTTRAK